jgi:hypothetical protein
MLTETWMCDRLTGSSGVCHRTGALFGVDVEHGPADQSLTAEANKSSLSIPSLASRGFEPQLLPLAGT